MTTRHRIDRSLVSLGLWALVIMPVLAAGLVACQPQEPQPTQPAVDTTAIMSILDSMRTAFDAAVAAGDFQKLAALYATDALYSPPTAPPVEGRDSIRAHFQQSIPPGATLDIRPIDTRVLGPNWLYEYGTATLSFTPGGASATQETQYTYFALFRKSSAGWRIHREVLSLNQPPPSGS